MAAVFGVPASAWLQPARACLLSRGQKLLHSRTNSHPLPPEGGTPNISPLLHARKMIEPLP
jgi:hypothetical protein